MRFQGWKFLLAAAAVLTVGLLFGHFAPPGGAILPVAVGMTSLVLETSHFELGIVPVADAFSGTVSTDVISMKNHNHVRFLFFEGAGGVGTRTITVEACDDTTPSSTSAVPFRYRRTVAGSDPGAWAAATASGFATTAGANTLYEVEVAAEALLSSGYGYVRAKSVEVDVGAVLGGCAIEMLEPRIADGAPTTATA